MGFLLTWDYLHASIFYRLGVSVQLSAWFSLSLSLSLSIAVLQGTDKTTERKSLALSALNTMEISASVMSKSTHCFYKCRDTVWYCLCNLINMEQKGHYRYGRNLQFLWLQFSKATYILYMVCPSVLNMFSLIVSDTDAKVFFLQLPTGWNNKWYIYQQQYLR